MSLKREAEMQGFSLTRRLLRIQTRWILATEGGNLNS